MNKFYIIVPLVLLTGFVFLYNGFIKEVHLKEKQQQEEAARVKAEEDAKKKAAEEKAAQEARERQAERDRVAREKEEKRQREQAKADAEVAAKTQEYLKLAESYNVEIAKISAQLNALRAKKEALALEALDAAKQTELTRIARQNADLEVQRVTAMLQRKIEESSLARMPVVATTEPQK